MTRMRALAVAAAAALVGTAVPARSSIIEVSLTASRFFGRSGPELTGEVPPQGAVAAIFTIDTEGPRDVPDFVEPATNSGDAYEVLNVYTTPVAAQLQIADYSYPLSDLVAYLGYVDGSLAQILLSGREGECQMLIDGAYVPAPAHCMSAGTNDFLLSVDLGTPFWPPYRPLFSYATVATASTYRAYSVHVSVSIDGGEAVELGVDEPDPVEDGVVCAATRSVREAAGGLADDAEPGDLLCEPSGEAARARSTGGPAALRDAKVAAAAAAWAGPSLGMQIETELGTHRLDAMAADRLLLPAATGTSRAVQKPAGGLALRCATVARSPGSPRFRTVRRVPVLDGAGGADYYDVRRPSRLCVGPDGLGRDAGALLCYRARRSGARPGPKGGRVWVAHALGVEDLAVSRARELCVPAAAE